MTTRTKTRGPGKSPYCGPYGTPVAHVQYREGRHMEPDRIPFHRHEVPVSLRLMDVSKESMENVRKVATSIKRLLAPSLKLQTVPDCLVAYLDHLERLDLGNNRLTDAAFPDSMKSLELLVELRLNDNLLTRVPPCVRRMRNMCRLDLSNNQLDNAAGLERLKKLQFLVLDNNNLSSVFKDISSLKKLEMLRCSSNNLRDVPRDIRNLRHLRDLDLSNNRIALLPTDVFQLPRLECFNASQNQVGKVPSFNVKVQNRRWISSVDLSDNNLVKFPGHLMQLAQKLDLSCNKIRTLSWATLKKMDMDRDQELKLDSNPLVYPPTDVCESGLKTIVQFFQESQADVKTYQGVKVLVIGSHRSGKSSLIHSLVDQQARLCDDSTTGETAAGIDAYEMSFDYDVEDGKPGKSLNLCLWDLCGDPFYLYPHYIFHEQPSITVLTFSMADYSAEKFAHQVGAWFDWMIAKTNKLVVILVGTKSDLVNAKKAGEITREVREKLTKHLQKRQTLIESRIKEIEKRPVISPTLSEQLKTYMRLLQAKFTVQTEVITTSSKTFDGFDKLREAIETLANDRKLFPNVMRVIPTFWVEVENWVEERGNALLVPVMPWDEFSEEVTTRFGMKHLLVSITQYLHESGKVLWFSNSPSLKEIVFLRPSWLFDVLKQVFRHDLEAAAFTPDDTLKVIAFTPSKFDRLKQDLLNDGVVDRELLKALLVSLIPADISKPSLEVLQILTERLEMGYPVSKKSRDQTYSLSADKDAEGKAKVNKLLIPWFRRSSEPDSFREKWRSLRDRRRLAVVFQFPCYMPPGLFELMTVRAHHEKHKLAFLAHWGGGVHAQHRDEKVQLLITYFREGSQDLLDDVSGASSTTTSVSASSSPSPSSLVLGDDNYSGGGGDDVDDGFEEGGDGGGGGGARGRGKVRTDGEEEGSGKNSDDEANDDRDDDGEEEEDTKDGVRTGKKTGAAPPPTATTTATPTPASRGKNPATPPSPSPSTATKTAKDHRHQPPPQQQQQQRSSSDSNSAGSPAQQLRQSVPASSPASSARVAAPSLSPSSAANSTTATNNNSNINRNRSRSSTSTTNDNNNKKKKTTNASNNNNNNSRKNNNNSNTSGSSKNKKKDRSRGQELTLPETIEEVEEEEEEEEFMAEEEDAGDEEEQLEEEEDDDDPLTSSGRSTGVVDNRRPASGSSKGKAAGSRVRIPTECNGDEENPVVLKLEIRDDSPDKQDQTPASSMWNILLPLLMDFEDLLTAYTGVLMERRTSCPICKEASYLGEWLTPKETQGMNTRACDSCHQQVDTAFLVQPREKKRVVINRNRFRHRRPSDPPVNGEVTNMTSCAPSSDAPSEGEAPP